jgi:F-type H+-transporting ATPase subunit delta
MSMKSTRRIKQAARQLFRLCKVDGRLDDGRVRQVAQLLAASQRRGALATLSELQRLVRLDLDRRTAIVESAVPLTPELRERVTADLHQRYGAGVTASFMEQPALIGGMRIKVGSDVFDSSVRARLAALAARL